MVSLLDTVRNQYTECMRTPILQGQTSLAWGGRVVAAQQRLLEKVADI